MKIKDFSKISRFVNTNIAPYIWDGYPAPKEKLYGELPPFEPMDVVVFVNHYSGPHPTYFKVGIVLGRIDPLHEKVRIYTGDYGHGNNFNNYRYSSTVENIIYPRLELYDPINPLHQKANRSANIRKAINEQTPLIITDFKKLSKTLDSNYSPYHWCNRPAPKEKLYGSLPCFVPGEIVYDFDWEKVFVALGEIDPFFETCLFYTGERFENLRILSYGRMVPYNPRNPIHRKAEISKNIKKELDKLLELQK